MITITPTLEIPPEIAEGLANGIYYRVGGVIREFSGKQPIVTWLRDVPNAVTNNLPTIANLASSTGWLK